MAIRNVQSLPQLVRGAAGSFGSAPALQGPLPSNNQLTYQQLEDCMCRAAGALRAHNLVPGDRVLLLLEPRPEWAAAFFGIVQAGLVAVPIPCELPAEVIAAVAAHCQPKLAIVSDRTGPLIAPPVAIPTLSIDSLLQAKRPVDPDNDPAASDLAMLAFTSGSTQQPRAVELTHGNLLSNLDALLQLRGGGPGDAMLSMLPPAHLFELMVGLLAPLACGARVVYSGAPLPNRLIAAMREHQITHALAVSALVECLYQEVFSRLVEAGVLEPTAAGGDLAEIARRLESDFSADQLEQLHQTVRNQIGDTFQSLIVGGAAIDPALARVISALGVRLEVGYGLTEASPVVSLGLSSECPPRCVGRPLPGIDVRIGDNDEILVRGPNVMRGYYHNATATQEVLHDGWLKTGDRGCLDDEGFLFITGRLKEAMVTAAGETIYPEEIEPYYHDPHFAECCVSGLPDNDGNDVPTLFVVPATPDASSEELEQTLAELRAAAPSRCRIQRMVRLPVPLPRTPAGKIRRRILAQQFLSREPTS